MRNKKSIVFDADAVIFNFYKGFSNVASIALHKEIKEKNIAYNLADRFEISSKDVSYVLKVMEQKFNNLPILQGANNAFNLFKKDGFSIHIVTSIPEHLKDMRMFNFNRNDMHPDTIDCVGTNPKLDAIEKYKPIAFVDDRIQHLAEVKDLVPNRIWINNGDDQKGFEDKHNHITEETPTLIEWANKTHLLSHNFKKEHKRKII